MLITVPAKTFLLGEYVCLQQQPALIITHPPFFSLAAELRPESSAAIIASTTEIKFFPNFHLASPAGKLLNIASDFFKAHILNFLDPFNGKGGFGASSAAFVALARLQDPARSSTDILTLYRTLTADTPMPPSGADVYAQAVMTQLTIPTAEVKWPAILLFAAAALGDPVANDAPLIWPFEHYQLWIFATGNKVATHQHLTQCPPIATAELVPLVHNAYQALIKKDFELLRNALQQYQSILSRDALTHPHTIVLLQQLATMPEIIVAKGCGALGADTILVITEKQEKAAQRAFLAKLSRLGLQRVI